MSKLKTLVDDLYWEYDRMSSSGQSTLDEIAVLVKTPTQKEMNNIMKNIEITENKNGRR
tara:strand:- start:44 stop:220 length:177 start_codon:yes stop_codon:yes gene_type:complete